MTQANQLQFPADFVWGTATASYQIEGAVHEDGRGESIWDRYSHTAGNTSNGDTGDVACDHYHRWRDDIKLMQNIGINAYRLSLAWPRIIPQGRGEINEAGLAFYDQLIDGLIAAGITPWITLYHWDLPQVLEDEGGWANRATAYAYAEYVDVVTKRYGDRVKHWITLNEPWCSSILGYYEGRHAPGRQSLADGLAASHTLLLGHGLAMPLIRRNVADAQAGITLNLTYGYAANDTDEDRAAAKRIEGFLNRWFLDPLYGRGYPQDMVELYGEAAPTIEDGDLDIIAAPTDFLGINFYNPSFVRHDDNGSLLSISDKRQEDREYTAMDWVVYPDGFYDLLMSLNNTYPIKAIYITENGAAFADEVTTDANGEPVVHDPQRVNYYREHISRVQQAMNDGVPLKGYFAWSLMDNFEWGYGYTKRFGLYYVDYTTQQRILKDSGRWYAALIDRQSAPMPA